MNTATKDPRFQQDRITIYKPQVKKKIDSFKFSEEEKPTDFKKITVEQLESGSKKLTPGMVIVFNDGKMAKLKPLASKTSVKHIGALCYTNPYNGERDMVSVLAEAVVNGGEGSIKGLSHFLEKK